MPHILSHWLRSDSIPCFGLIFLHQVTFISFLLSILILFLYLFSIVYKVSYIILHIVTVAPPSRFHPFLLGSPARCTSCRLNVSIYLFRIPASFCKPDHNHPYKTDIYVCNYELSKTMLRPSMQVHSSRCQHVHST
jgi:hypothetical protein